MFEINIRANTQDYLKKLGRIQRDLATDATVEALNKTALDARDDLKAEMARVFDRPTRFTLNSLFIKRATRGRLRAEVAIKDTARGGNPAVRYLEPQVRGGARNAKGFEKVLQRTGILPPGMVAIPGRDADLDQYGNIRAAEIKRMVAQLRAQSDPVGKDGGKPKRKRRAQFRYFVATRGGKPIGIMKAKGRSGDATMLLFFGRPTPYRERFDFEQIVDQAVEINYERQFLKAIGRRLK